MDSQPTDEKEERPVREYVNEVRANFRRTYELMRKLAGIHRTGPPPHLGPHKQPD
jgi:hypothetical protein